MNKKILIGLCALFMPPSVQGNTNTDDSYKENITPDRSKVLAFPGADDAGKYATGGASGTVYIVTSLADDSSEGTFRWAINEKGPRAIAFTVNGIIELQRPLELSNENVTIAGQTAPGDDICLKNYILFIQADNVAIRSIRSYMGADVKQKGDDAINGTKGNSNVVMNHCPLSQCTDECATFHDNSQLVLQRCTASEDLANSIHKRGARGYGDIWGGQKAPFHHNLLVHRTSRILRLCGSRYAGKPGEERVELFNNVIYNYGSDRAYASEDDSYNFLNNYYKPGPYSAAKGLYRCLFTVCVDDSKSQNEAGVHGTFRFEGDFMDTTYPSLADKQKKAPYKVNMDNTFGLIVKNDFVPEKSLLPKEASDIAEHTSLQPVKRAYKDILQFAGASHRRSTVGQRIMEKTCKGNCTYEGSHRSTNGMVDQPIDVGGWPGYKSEPTPTDSDRNGMPDEQEEKYSLGPSDPNDDAQYGLNKEYTGLKVYLNELVNHLYPTDSKK